MTGSAFNTRQFELAYTDGIEANYWYLVRHRLLQTVLDKHVPPGSKILDIGCGKGLFVSFLRQRAYDIWGVELAEVEQVAQAKAFVHTGTHSDTLHGPFRDSIQVILLLDVLEHQEDPAQFLQTLCTQFPNATHLLITVPARQELWSNYDVFYGHFKRFDIDALNKLNPSQDTSPLVIRYFFRLLYLPAFLTIHLFKKRKLATTPVVNLPNKVIHRLIAALIMLTDAVLPSRVRGTSLLVLIKLKA